MECIYIGAIGAVAAIYALVLGVRMFFVRTPKRDEIEQMMLDISMP